MTCRGTGWPWASARSHAEPAEPAVDGPLEVLDRGVVRHAQVHHRVVVHRRHVGQVVRPGGDGELVLGRVDCHGHGRRRRRRAGPGEGRSGENHDSTASCRLRDEGGRHGIAPLSAAGQVTARSNSTGGAARRRAELLRARGQCQAADRGGRWLHAPPRAPPVPRRRPRTALPPRTQLRAAPGVAPGARAGGPAALGTSRRERVRPRAGGGGRRWARTFRCWPCGAGPAPSRSVSGPRSTAGSAWATARARSSATTGWSGSTPPRRSAPGRSPARSTTRAAIWATSTATASAPAGSTGPAKWPPPG